MVFPIGRTICTFASLFIFNLNKNEVLLHPYAPASIALICTAT